MDACRSVGGHGGVVVGEFVDRDRLSDSAQFPPNPVTPESPDVSPKYLF
jgi:hypothetical protein